MADNMHSILRGRLPAILLPVLFALGVEAPALAQQNPVCARLEAQLAAFDRGGADQSRDEQIRKYETAAQQQQAQIDRLTAQANRAGCSGGGSSTFFSIFSSQPAACGPLIDQIRQMKGNLDRINGDLARLQGSDTAAANDGQRRAIIGALAQNECGPQYRQAAVQAPQQRGTLFESLFGPGTVFSGTTVEGENTPHGSGYRTVCVRTCDGYYYPISYSTSPSKFPEDERTCQASCPAAEARLFTHRNPGEDINQAVSTDGQMYTALQNIQDPTAAPGDVVVSDDKSKPRVDAQGRPLKLEIPPKPAKPDAAAAQEDDAPVVVKRDPNKPVRQVGPTFIAR
jgi:hypothetical protein